MEGRDTEDVEVAWFYLLVMWSCSGLSQSPAHTIPLYE
jgi:hypothetical protein